MPFRKVFARCCVNTAIVEGLVRTSKELGWTPAQTALTWILDQGIIPIVGARTFQQFEENIDLSGKQLPGEHRQLLDVLSAIEPGFPNDFLNSDAVKYLLFNGQLDKITF